MDRFPTSGELAYLRELAGGPRYETTNSAYSRTRNACRSKGWIQPGRPGCGLRPGYGWELTAAGRLIAGATKETTS